MSDTIPTFSRRARREVAREIARAAKKRGIPIPEALPCGSCRGTGRRWRYIPRWIRRCLDCGGDGISRKPVLLELARALLVQRARERGLL